MMILALFVEVIIFIVALSMGLTSNMRVDKNKLTETNIYVNHVDSGLVAMYIWVIPFINKFTALKDLGWSTTYDIFGHITYYLFLVYVLLAFMYIFKISKNRNRYRVYKEGIICDTRGLIKFKNLRSFDKTTSYRGRKFSQIKLVFDKSCTIKIDVLNSDMDEMLEILGEYV